MENEKCPYSVCCRNDSKKYGYQFLFLLISLGFLLKNESQFNFVSVFLFTAPIWADLLGASYKGKLFKLLCYFYLIVNAAISVFCFLGLCGLVIDGGSVFELPADFMIYPGLSIKKSYLVRLLFLDLAVPKILSSASPSKETSLFFNITATEKKQGTARKA